MCVSVVWFCFCFFPLQPEKKRHMGHMTNTALVCQVSFALYDSESQVAQSTRGSGWFVRGFLSRRVRSDSSALCLESLPPALWQGNSSFSCKLPRPCAQARRPEHGTQWDVLALRVQSPYIQTPAGIVANGTSLPSRLARTWPSSGSWEMLYEPPLLRHRVALI